VSEPGKVQAGGGGGPNMAPELRAQPPGLDEGAGEVGVAAGVRVMDRGSGL